MIQRPTPIIDQIGVGKRLGDDHFSDGSRFFVDTDAQLLINKVIKKLPGQSIRVGAAPALGNERDLDRSVSGRTQVNEATISKPVTRSEDSFQSVGIERQRDPKRTVIEAVGDTLGEE